MILAEGPGAVSQGVLSYGDLSKATGLLSHDTIVSNVTAVPLVKHSSWLPAWGDDLPQEDPGRDLPAWREACAAMLPGLPSALSL